jgi:hypothetical protein
MTPKDETRFCSHIDETAPVGAPGPGNLTFGDILKMSDVFRWHSTWPKRPQNLAEHSYRVALLAVRLAYEVNPRLGPYTELAILRLGLLHDVPETQFGDIPSPTKWRLRDTTGVKYDEVMDRRFWDDRATVDPWTAAPDFAIRLVRVADITEAALFYLKHGDREELTRGLVHECLAAAFQNLPGVFPIVYDLLEREGAGEDVLQGWQKPGETA